MECAIMKNKRLIISMLMLLVTAFFSACGEKEEPAAEDSWFSELNTLAVGTVLEKSELKDLVQISASDIVIDQIYYGAFSQESANEIFVVCKILNTIHAVTCDRRAGVLFDADTLQLVAFKDFPGDETEVRCLQAGNGQKRILHLSNVIYQGFRSPYIKLYAVQGSEWVDIPIDIMEWIPTELVSAEESYGVLCYYMMDERLVVTWESFPRIRPEQVSDPAELVGMYVWDPYKEQFVPDSLTEQPVIQR